MTIQLPGARVVLHPHSPGPTAAAGGDASPTWRCPRCGTERHFPGPVPAGAAIPCAARGANTVPPVRE